MRPSGDHPKMPNPMKSPFFKFAPIIAVLHAGATASIAQINAEGVFAPKTAVTKPSLTKGNEAATFSTLRVAPTGFLAHGGGCDVRQSTLEEPFELELPTRATFCSHGEGRDHAQFFAFTSPFNMEVVMRASGGRNTDGVLFQQS